MDFEYRKHTDTEAADTFVAWIAICVTFSIFTLAAWQYSREFFWWLIAFNVIFAVFFLWHIVSNLSLRSEFVFRIHDEFVECIVPVKFCGESFRIRLDDIAKIERRSSGESSDWFLVDRTGRQYWLTPSYDNPIRTIVDRIKELNPSVVEEST